MSTDVADDNDARPLVRCKPHGVDASRCIICLADTRAAERAAMPTEGTLNESLTSVPLLDSLPGCTIVEAVCAEFDVSVSQLHQLVNAEHAQIGKHRKRGLFEAFDAILDDTTQKPSEDNSQ